MTYPKLMDSIEQFTEPLIKRLYTMSVSFKETPRSEQRECIDNLRNGIFKFESNLAVECLEEILARITDLQRLKPIHEGYQVTVTFLTEEVRSLALKEKEGQRRRQTQESCDSAIVDIYLEELSFYKEEINRLITHISRRSKKEKIQTTLTVTELACKFRVEALCGIIDERKNKAQLARSIISLHSSKKKHNPKFDEFYNAYARPNQKDLAALKKRFKEAIEKIEELEKIEFDKLGVNNRKNNRT